MSKAALLALLRTLVDEDDTEDAHIRADDALIAFIGDAEIAKAYHAIGKWYA